MTVLTPDTSLAPNTLLTLQDPVPAGDGDPPPRLTSVDPDYLSRAAQRLYDQLRHLEPGDGTYPWAALCAMFAAPVDPLYDLLAGGDIPWAPAMDPDLAGEVLDIDFATALAPWLGQFAGVTRRDELPLAGQYVRLRETSGARRGTPT